MRKLAAVFVLAVLTAPAARADIGLHIDETTVSRGGVLRGTGNVGGMPVYLVPEEVAPHPFACFDHGICTPRISRPPGDLYVRLGNGGAARRFTFRLPAAVEPGRYKLVTWCRRCGGSLILAGSTIGGQTVTVARSGDGVPWAAAIGAVAALAAALAAGGYAVLRRR